MDHCRALDLDRFGHAENGHEIGPRWKGGDMTDDDENIGLDEDEIKTIIRGFLRQRGERGATEAEMRAVVHRVEQMHFDGLMAELICTGRVEADWDASASEIILTAKSPVE